jgi:hypothetical protein
MTEMQAMTQSVHNGYIDAFGIAIYHSQFDVPTGNRLLVIEKEFLELPFIKADNLMKNYSKSRTQRTSIPIF